MLRSLFCAAAVLSLLLSLFLLPQTASARRCPVKDPETLLSLYQNSDAIYIASFDKITEGETIKSDDEYSVQEITKHFTISSTLKGESRKFFELDDRNYIYPTTPVEPQAEPPAEPETAEIAAEPEEEEETDPAELKPGDTMLLFVTSGEEEEGPSLADYRDGIKKMPMEKIGVYEARIKELNSIFGAKKVSEAALLEWVIRCAQDPVTRWEGTFELLKSVQNKEWKDQAAERRKERLANGEEVEAEANDREEPAGEDVEGLSHRNFDPGVFATMIDANQKQTLANILLNEYGSSEKRSEPVLGDRELVELVKRWGDPRLIGFLLDKLRAGSDDPSANADMMAMIAEILDDDDAAEIAEKYQENAYGDDNDLVEAEEEGKPPAAENAEAETIEAEEVPGSVVKPETEVEKPEIRKQTYKELRTELMQKFLAQCDKAAAGDEEGNESKNLR